MFGIGFYELLVVAVVALVFVGPKRLPELMQKAGKFFVQARRMTTDVRSTIDSVIRDAEKELHQEELEKVKKMLEDAKNKTLEETKNVLETEAIEHPPEDSTLSTGAVAASESPAPTTGEKDPWEVDLKEAQEGHHAESVCETNEKPANSQKT